MYMAYNLLLKFTVLKYPIIHSEEKGEWGKTRFEK